MVYYFFNIIIIYTHTRDRSVARINTIPIYDVIYEYLFGAHADNNLVSGQPLKYCHNHRTMSEKYFISIKNVKNQINR